MARRNVTVTPMMEVRKHVRKGTDLGGGNLGLRQIRKTTNTIRSAKLLKHQACVAGQMAGKTGKLGDIQKAFRVATKACAAKSAGVAVET